MSWMKGYNRNVDRVPRKSIQIQHNGISLFWIAHSIILSCDHPIVGLWNIFTMLFNEILKNNIKINSSKYLLFFYFYWSLTNLGF